jgi:hypothetical protein
MYINKLPGSLNGGNFLDFLVEIWTREIRNTSTSANYMTAAFGANNIVCEITT